MPAGHAGEPQQGTGVSTPESDPTRDPARPGLERGLSAAALALLLLGCFVVLRPFVTALLWATVMWISLAPLHQRVLERLSGRRTVAASVLTFAVALLLLLPLVVVGASLADSSRELIRATRDWIGTSPAGPPGWLADLPVVGSRISAYWTVLASDSQRLLTEAQRFIEPATSWILGRGIAVGRGMTELVLSVLITFFLLRDGIVLRWRAMAAMQRIAGPTGEHLVELAIRTVRSVVNGILGTALVQGVLAGIGFAVAGVPGSVLLGMLTFLLSFVPMGPPLVWIPATLWLYQQGASGWAGFMLVWGIGVSSVDNLVKPWLIAQGSTLPFLLIFFGVVGGAIGFGFVGVFLGPTLLAVTFRLVQDWTGTVSQAGPTLTGPEAQSGATPPPSP